MEKKPPVSIMLVVTMIVFAGIFTGTMGGVILASYRITPTPAAVIAVRPTPKINVLKDISSEMGVKLNMIGSASYLWGMVQQYEGMDPSGRKVIVELDVEKGYLTALETYGQYPDIVKIDEDTALSAAEEFVSQYAPDLNLAELTMSLTPPGDDTTIKVYRILWEGISPEGVRLPQKVVVYVDAYTGKVSDYIRVTIPIQIDTEPTLSRSQAEEVLRKELVVLEDWQLLEAHLMVLPDEQAGQSQKLVWAFDITIKLPELLPLYDTVFIDAHTGGLFALQDEN
jgi:hypothetical protein